MCQAYREQYGLNAIYLLPANLYGPGDNFDPVSSHVIPAMIRKCVEAAQSGEKEITLWGDGKPTREFLFVSDAAEGIIMAVEKYNEPEPVNLGSGQEISICELAATIARLAGYDGVIKWDLTRPAGQIRRCVDTTRARDYFGFIAKTDLHTGLQKTIEWYKEVVSSG
jgi:GDP-L-fucose synthase